MVGLCKIAVPAKVFLYVRFFIFFLEFLFFFLIMWGNNRTTFEVAVERKCHFVDKKRALESGSALRIAQLFIGATPPSHLKGL